MDPSRIQPSRTGRRGSLRGILLVGGCMVAAGLLLARTIEPPAAFPAESTFTIARGESLSTIAAHLAEASYIRSPLLFKVTMRLLGSDRRVTHGEFYFAEPVTLLDVALRISGKNFGILQHRVVFPEGFTNREIAARLAKTFPEFDSATFLELAKDKEGYLFPDTYGFSPNIAPAIVIETMSNNFKLQTNKFAVDFAESSRSREAVITMASILEKEASGATDAPVIAGILWKRLDQGIPLQVDAPFYYLFGKSSSQLTAKELDSPSPYNTYNHTGLPPAPIGNPGSAMIDAALHPVSSPYLYYLHDATGAVHYARTFEEHKANKQKFLK